MDEALRYKILKLVQQDPTISQRDLSRELGISLGKVNYCMKGLMERGLVKARNFRNSRHKLDYAYYLTPKGFEEKGRVTLSYLRARVQEYEQLEAEIRELRREARQLDRRPDAG